MVVIWQNIIFLVYFLEIQKRQKKCFLCLFYTVQVFKITNILHYENRFDLKYVTN